MSLLSPARSLMLQETRSAPSAYALCFGTLRSFFPATHTRWKPATVLPHTS